MQRHLEITATLDVKHERGVQALVREHGRTIIPHRDICHNLLQHRLSLLELLILRLRCMQLCAKLLRNVRYS